MHTTYLYEEQYGLRTVISCTVLGANKLIHKGLELLDHFKRGRVSHTLQKEAALLVILHQLAMGEEGRDTPLKQTPLLHDTGLVWQAS